MLGVRKNDNENYSQQERVVFSKPQFATARTGRQTTYGVAVAVALLALPARAEEPGNFGPSGAEREAPADDGGEIEVMRIQGASIGDRLEDSDRAVTVISTYEDQKRAADLGEVLARTQGVGVRRSGGLGSGARISLNGLTDDQIRFFLDGIPLELAGFPFGLANVPVNLVERVEVYRGVVPVQFGADALGGAINMVSTYVDGTTASASYQVGSFGTHRLTGDVQLVDPDSGWLTRATAFLDTADNDYAVDVEVSDESGGIAPATIERFNDDYRAAGAQLELGVMDRDWAEKLTLKGFFADFDRDIQHNVVMTVPYGEVRSFERSAGATLRYEQPLSDRIRLDVVSGYNRQRTRFRDRGECVYDWFGECIRTRAEPGEIEPRARDQVLWDDNVYARVNANVELAHHHELNLSLSPTYTERTGDERLQSDPAARDPLSADRRLFSFVAGAEYRARLFDERLANTFFVKGYVQSARSEEVAPGGAFLRLDRDTQRPGFGNSLRYQLTDELALKASYEWATRLPRVEEAFGDGVLILANLGLTPETSHNVNLGGNYQVPTALGTFTLDVNGFLRESEDLIVLLNTDRYYVFQNVFGARSVGVEGAAQWSSPGDWLTVGGNGTYLDFRNTSGEGTFGAYEGDRIPNRPYLFANGFLRLEAEEVFRAWDSIAFDWNTRYVGEFFRGWESVGLREFKQTVDAQLFHTASLVYSGSFAASRVSFAAEAQNLTNERLFDFFGAQRPGRALFLKTTVEL